MKTFLISFVIFISCFNNLIADKYDLELIKVIQTGEENDKLGFFEHMSSGPFSFTIFQNKYFYILDSHNLRIAIYDKDFNFIKIFCTYKDAFAGNEIIDLYNKLMFAYSYISVDLKGNVCLCNTLDNGGFLKLNTQGKSIYFIKSKEIDWTSLKYNSFFPYEKNVFFYKYAGKKRELQLITDKGEIKGEDEAKKLLTNINNIRKDFIIGNFERKKKLTDFIIQNNYIFLNDKMVLWDDLLFLDLIHFFRENNINKSNKNNVYFDNERIKGASLIGFDRNDNYYFKSGRYTIIYDQYLNVIEYIDKEYYPRVTVDDSGDLYYMSDIHPDGIAFYRLKRTWALDQDEKALKIDEEEIPLQIAVINKLLYKNFLKDGISYHPIRVFNDDVDFPWIENSWGSGIGDYIGVEFDEDITVDEIEILIGYFRRGYFKLYNRIKKLHIELDGKRYKKEFEDEMVSQKIVFEDPVTFKKIRLIIKAVYKSEYDDTAITEVRFYYKGKKILIDTSRYAEDLK